MKNVKKKISRRKAQVAAEFAIVFGAALFFMTLFFMGIQENNSLKIRQRRDVATKEVALTVQNEIGLASESIDGYMRNFTLPPNIGGKAYEAKVNASVIYVKTDDYKHTIALPVANVSNTPVILTMGGNGNNINKTNGLVYINPL